MAERWHGARASAALGALLCVLWGAPLAAQAPPDTLGRDTVVALEAVVVTTVRPTTTTGGASAVVVDPDSLHVVPAPSLEQVLRELPFVAVRENSRGQAEITVRGSDSRQVAVLLDGVPLTLGWDSRTDPAVVPVLGARSVTLVRGLHSVLYGPNVLGGVVEMALSGAPGAPAADPPLRLRAGVEHHGGHSLSAMAARALELPTADVSLRAGAGYRDRPGTVLPGAVADTLTERGSLRANSDLRQLSGFVAARYHSLDGAWLGMSASAFDARRGVPPELHVREPRLWRYPEESRLVAVLTGGTGERATRWGVGDLEASLGVDLGAQRIRSYSTARYETVEGTEAGDDRTLTLRLLGDHSLPGGATLTGAATLAGVRHLETLDGGEPTEYRQRLWSVASEVAVPMGDARLSAGAALDGADTPETGGRPPLGALWAAGGRLGASTLVAGDRVRLHAAASRRARFPALRELYSGALGRFEPNPELGPETLLGFEAGATTRDAGLELQAVGFHHRLADAVVRTVTEAGRYRRENRHRIHSTGLEVLAGWSRGGLSLLADLMVQEVRVLDPSAPEGELRAEHQPGLRAGVDASLPLPLELRGLVGAEYTGRQHCVHPDRGTMVALAGSGRVDLGVQRRWQLGPGPLGTLRTTLALDNAADAAAYDQCGLPQPGRTLRFAVEIG